MSSNSNSKCQKVLLTEFSWEKCTKSSTKTFKSKELGTGSIKIECSNSNSSSCNFNLKFTITFDEDLSFGENNTLELVAFVNQSGYCTNTQGYYFVLNKQSNTIYCSESRVVYESVFYNYSTFDLNIKIISSDKRNKEVQELESLMKNLLEEKTHSDLKLVVNDQVFHVHKNILASRNKVICNMIEKDMKEKNTNVIQLDNWDPMVVQQLLEFWYTNTCNVTLNPHELYKLAHYLDVEHLQQKCKDYLISNINIRNVVETLELSCLSNYNLSSLKDEANRFISSNESLLAQNLDYIEYLSENIDNTNISFVLTFANKYKLNSLLEKAINHVIDNKKLSSVKNFLEKNPNLMFKLLDRFVNEVDTYKKKEQEKDEAKISKNLENP